MLPPVVRFVMYLVRNRHGIRVRVGADTRSVEAALRTL